jgi:uncharacterized protein
MKILLLSQICAERNADPENQQRRLVALLRAGADIEAMDKNGVTALHHAVRFRNVIAVKALLEHGANVNCVCRRSGSTPLHRAVIASGAPNTAGKHQEVLEIIRLLLAAGADASIRNKRNLKPVDYAKRGAVKTFLKAHDVGSRSFSRGSAGR